MTRTDSEINFDSLSPVIPVLTSPVPETEIYEELQAQFNALESQKADFMASAEDLMAAIRPEIEKLTAKLVRDSLQLAWLKRSKSNSD